MNAITATLLSGPILRTAGADGYSLEQGWDKLWGIISSQLGPITMILSIVAGCLLIWSAFKIFWQKRNGQGQGGKMTGLIWTAIISAFFVAPGIVVKFVLKFLDIIVNLLIKIGGGVTS